MFDLKNGLSLHFVSRVICVVMFNHAVVFLLLTACTQGETQVVTPHQPIVALLGDDIILPSHLNPNINAVELTLEWSRQDLNPSFVYVRREGRELLNFKNPAYTGRTSLFIEELQNGNVSLKLSNVKISDEGKYRCSFPTMNKEYFVQLVVGAVSSPVIILLGINSEGVVLGCESKGWYPQPEVSWLDSEGKLLPAEPSETVRGTDGLYVVRSNVTAKKTDNNTFTCQVQQHNINQTRGTHIHVPGDLFMVQSSSCVVLMCCCLVAVFVLWKHKKAKTPRQHEDQTEEQNKALLMSPREDKMDLERKVTELEKQSGEKMKDLENKDKINLEREIKLKENQKLEESHKMDLERKVKELEKQLGEKMKDLENKDNIKLREQLEISEKHLAERETMLKVNQKLEESHSNLEAKLYEKEKDIQNLNKMKEELTNSYEALKQENMTQKTQKQEKINERLIKEKDQLLSLIQQKKNEIDELKKKKDQERQYQEIIQLQLQNRLAEKDKYIQELNKEIEEHRRNEVVKEQGGVSKESSEDDDL